MYNRGYYSSNSIISEISNNNGDQNSDFISIQLNNTPYPDLYTFIHLKY